MNLIIKIINWLKKLFNKLFGRKKITKKIKNDIHNAKNKRYLKGYGIFIEDTYNEVFPIYLYLNNSEKKKIIQQINKIKNEYLCANNILNEEELREIDLLINGIEKNKISIYQSQQISEKLVSLPEKLEKKTIEKEQVIQIMDDLKDIINNFDCDIRERVRREYTKINYITLTTVLIDETNEELRILEENYKRHRYNKSYYDRELRKIKERMENLRKIRDSQSIRNEIYALRKEIYTKSKDKYDLLYNDEVFLNIEKECDDLLKKVDKRVIDIKKITSKKKEEESKNSIDKEKQKEDNKQQEETLENILKRFKDMELARKIILLNQNNETSITSVHDLLAYLDRAYYNFINGEKAIFYFERNKTKTELVKLFNDIQFINCQLREEEFTMIEHINYSLDDLLMATISKKKELESMLKEKYNYREEKHELAILVDNKLMIQEEKEKDREKANLSLVKKMDTTNY